MVRFREGIPASTNGGPFQYTGQMWLPEVGLYYYKNRFYSPTAGRFLQTDPIGQADNPNLYAYVHNDPVNKTDPLGLTPVPEIIVTGSRILPIDPISLAGLMSSLAGMFAGRDLTNDKNDGKDQDNDKKCAGPPSAPGTGESQSQLQSQLDANAKQAASERYNPLNLLWFYDQVRNSGPWDYKQYGSGYQDFGNYNYGYTAAAMGVALDFTLRQAGRAQIAAGTSRPGWGSPGYLDGLIGGTPPYGDDPHDQEMIKRGFSDFAKGCK